MGGTPMNNCLYFGVGEARVYSTGAASGINFKIIKPSNKQTRQFSIFFSKKMVVKQFVQTQNTASFGEINPKFPCNRQFYSLAGSTSLLVWETNLQSTVG